MLAAQVGHGGGEIGLIAAKSAAGEQRLLTCRLGCSRPGQVWHNVIWDIWGHLGTLGTLASELGIAPDADIRHLCTCAPVHRNIGQHNIVYDELCGKRRRPQRPAREYLERGWKKAVVAYLIGSAVV